MACLDKRFTPLGIIAILFDNAPHKPHISNDRRFILDLFESDGIIGIKVYLK